MVGPHASISCRLALAVHNPMTTFDIRGTMFVPRSIRTLALFITMPVIALVITECYVYIY